MRSQDGELLKDAVLQERYRVVEVVNKGPGSRTYRCIDTKRNRSIFVKELITTFTDPSLRQQAIEQFKFEAKILFKLKHENLPKFEDYFDYEGNRYLTFDYISGERLNKIVEKTPGFLSEKQVLDWGLELCSVLHYLHNTKPNPVIFRDLSPESTLLAEDGKLRLIDFGIAKIYDSDAKTMGIAKTMTAHYSPIEQHAGTTDERSDIYSLGATLYYLIAKEPPMDCVERIIDDEPMEPPGKFNPSISPELERVILKAMEVDKKDRYQKVEEVQAELEKITPSEAPSGPDLFMDDDEPPPEEVSEEDDFRPISFEMSEEDRGYGSREQLSVSRPQYDSASSSGRRGFSIGRDEGRPGRTAPSRQYDRGNNIAPGRRDASYGTPSAEFETNRLPDPPDFGRDREESVGRRRFLEDRYPRRPASGEQRPPRRPSAPEPAGRIPPREPYQHRRPVSPSHTPGYNEARQREPMDEYEKYDMEIIEEQKRMAARRAQQSRPTTPQSRPATPQSRPAVPQRPAAHRPAPPVQADPYDNYEEEEIEEEVIVKKEKISLWERILRMLRLKRD